MFLMPLAAGGDVVILIIVAVLVLNVIRRVIAKAREAQEEQRPQPPQRPAQAPEKSRPATEIDEFLREMGRQSGLPAPPRQQPAPPRAGPARPQQRPRPSAPPPRPPAAPKEEPIQSRHVPTSRPAALATAYHPTEGDLSSPLSVTEPSHAQAVDERDVGEQLDRLLPKPYLQRALVLREVFGACRARRRYRPMDW